MSVRRPVRKRLLIAGAIGAALIGLAAVILVISWLRSSSDRGSVLTQSERTAMPALRTPADIEWPPVRLQIPEVAFFDAKGRDMRISDLRGKVVILNFWATWCTPCVVEMPALDRLQAAFGDETLAVVALSEDREGRRAVEPFLDKLGIKSLGMYFDRNQALAQALGADKLPATYILDREGRAVGRLIGPADWDSEVFMSTLRGFLAENGSDPAAANVR